MVTHLRMWAGRLDDAVGAVEILLLGVLMVAITATVLAQVVSRYILHDPLIWTDEVSRYLLVWISLVGAAASVRLGSHYGMSVLVERLPVGMQRPLVALGTLLIAAFASVVLVFGVIETQDAARQRSISLPMRMHWAYMAIPVGGGLMLLHIAVRWIREGLWAPHSRHDHQVGEQQPQA